MLKNSLKKQWKSQADITWFKIISCFSIIILHWNFLIDLRRDGGFNENCKSSPLYIAFLAEDTEGSDGYVYTMFSAYRQHIIYNLIVDHHQLSGLQCALLFIHGKEKPYSWMIYSWVHLIDRVVLAKHFSTIFWSMLKTMNTTVWIFMW